MAATPKPKKVVSVKEKKAKQMAKITNPKVKNWMERAKESSSHYSK